MQTVAPPRPPHRVAALARRLTTLTRPPQGRRRRIAAWCAVPPLTLVSVVVGCRAADTDGITPVPQLLAFLPWLLLPAALGLLLGVVARWPAGCAWALLAAALTGWFVQPYDGGGPLPEPRGPVLAHPRVLTANLKFGGATHGLLAALRHERPDLVSVQECDARCAKALGSAALRKAYPYRNIVTGSPSEGSAILSRYPLTRRPGVRGELAMPGAEIRIAGRNVRFQVAHPMPPRPGGVGVWRTELGRLRAYAAARGTATTVIAGDFNSTQDHAAFRDLLDTGMHDSARAVGASRTPTWPSVTAPALGAQIDHVLVSDALRPRAARFLDLGGTDHRALLVDLDLYGG